MFTGLIEETGIISNIENLGGGIKLTITANKILEDIKIDASISVNGCCQTVIAYNDISFEVIAIEETLKKTNFGEFALGDIVNLERAMRMGDRLGGHMVSGHIDCVGEVVKIEKEETSTLFSIEFPKQYMHLIIPVGSICINGISLTVARLKENILTVAIIPHTIQVTNISKWMLGSKVNLEFDLVGKYIERMVKPSIN